MEFLGFSSSGAFVACMSLIIALCLCLLMTLTLFWWVKPNQKLQKLKKCGFGGPSPSFPLGNIEEMKRKNSTSSVPSSSSFGSSNLTRDIHSTVSPYYSSWQKSYGNHNDYEPTIANIYNNNLTW